MSVSPRTNWSKQPWMLLSAGDLAIERQQATDEGRELSDLAPEFDAIAALDWDRSAPLERAEALLDRVQATPLAPQAAQAEPDDLTAIQACRPDAGAAAGPAPTVAADRQERILGAWLGRCSGCLMGKPVEGRRSQQIRTYLEAQGRWPLTDYFSASAGTGVTPPGSFTIADQRLVVEGIHGMVEDDDTNYTAAGLALVERYGRGFGPSDVAAFWLSEMPFFHLCTAERVAYRNLVNSIPPPASATWRNPYREWIGAQIRADFYGYINPGDPQTAADMAWRDASISHVRNGLYGAMWVAAMLAVAWTTSDRAAIIAGGLAQVPAHSRLAQRLRGVLDLHAAGADYEAAIAQVRSRWDEANGHHWCHTISNAEIVATALLWGDGDPARSLGMAIMPGFDTDCNGATVGSVLGLALGAAAWPAHLVVPLEDTLRTGVAGFHEVRISNLAQRTLACCASA